MSLLGKRVHYTHNHTRSIPDSQIDSSRLSKEDLLALLNNIREGKDVVESVQKIILTHMRWALFISASYIGQYSCKSIGNDLDSEALLGLSIGANRLLRMKHDNVTGYLAYFIHSHLLECMHRSPTVRVPRRQSPVTTVPILITPMPIANRCINVKEFVEDLTSNETERQFAMWRIEGYSSQEIASFLKVSLSQVYLIRERIRKRYDERK